MDSQVTKKKTCHQWWQPQVHYLPISEVYEEAAFAATGVGTMGKTRDVTPSLTGKASSVVNT
jgi:hypothetical protein